MINQLILQAQQFVKEEAWTQASAALQKLILFFPNEISLQVELAWVAEQLNDLTLAKAAYLAALKLQSSAELWINLGRIYLQEANTAEATTAYLSAIQHTPDSALAWTHLGAAYQYSGQSQKAEEALSKAIKLSPSPSAAEYNLGYLYLQMGEWEKGWPLLEARDWYKPFEQHFTFPKWQQCSLEGKRLLIVPEAGHGDLIQFIRFIQQADALGVKQIDILCHPALVTLFRICFPSSNILDLSLPVPKEGWDNWVPAISLAKHFNILPDTPNLNRPYLFSIAAEQAIPHAPQKKNEKRKVGLAWRGNPLFENDRFRSIHDLQQLKQLAALKNITWCCLQHDVREEEKQCFHALGLDIDYPVIHDFLGMANQIVGLDVVVSVDTAAAHLAGAMGKQTYLMLPAYKTDWRWLLGRESTPWYQQMQLIRQSRVGDWEGVIQVLRNKLFSIP